MKEEGKGSKSPLTDSFLRYPNNKYVLLALLGATAGQGVVWYTGQFYALFFITITQKVDYLTAYWLIGISLIIGTPFFIFFGWLSDRIGRLRIILAGCVIAALTYFPLLAGLAKAVNPDLQAYAASHPIAVSVDESTCKMHVFVGPWSTFSDCDKATDFLTKAGLSFTTQPGPAGSPPVLKVGTETVEGFNADTWNEKLLSTGYPNLKKEEKEGKIVYSPQFADSAKMNWPLAILILTLMMIYVTMVYGPIAAFLVELFPTKIRYTSMSLPYHIGNGWFGGMLPLLATAIVASTGNIYNGLWYPIIVAIGTAIVGFFFLRETKEIDIAKT
jgi:MFS family permease